jgi:HSP20 family molecular chaperone IbpA
MSVVDRRNNNSSLHGGFDNFPPSFEEIERRHRDFVQDFERRIEEIHREIESHFPKSWLDRDLWLKPAAVGFNDDNRYNNNRQDNRYNDNRQDNRYNHNRQDNRYNHNRQDNRYNDNRQDNRQSGEYYDEQRYESHHQSSQNQSSNQQQQHYDDRNYSNSNNQVGLRSGNNNLGVSNNFGFDIEREIEEHRREMQRHFDQVEKHFAEIMRKHGVEIDEFGRREPASLPRVVNGRLQLDLDLPRQIDPSKVNVSVKDGDLVIQAEDRVEKPNEKSQVRYYRRSTLPPGTDANQIKADLVGGNKLAISAPVNQSGSGSNGRNVAINYN